MEPFLGQIINAAYSFAPRGYATCDGQIVSIAQQAALFSLLGVQYGGNGSSTFAYPNMQGQVSLHRGQAPGGSYYTQAQRGGSESAVMTLTTMPTHSHSASFAPTANLSATTANGTDAAPTAGYQLATAIDGDPTPDAQPNLYIPATSTNEVTLAGPVNISGTVVNQPMGSSTPFGLLNPYNTILTCIATQGIFPSRN